MIWNCINHRLQSYVLTSISLSLSFAICNAVVVGQDAKPADTAQPPTDRVILIQGAAGTPEYGEEFAKALDKWTQMAKERKMELTVLGKEESPDKTDRDALEAKLKEWQAIEGSSGNLWLVMIGHGTSERGVTKFNLRGLDVSAKELSGWLRAVQHPMIVAICSSSSAPFLPELSAPGRIVVTATKAGSENNYSRFGKYLAQTLGDASADLDHDDEVSLLEAFLSATGQTEKFYKEESRLATEHAIIDDNADRLGTGNEFFRGTKPSKAAPKGKTLDGDAARKTIVYSSPGVPKFTAAQLAERDALEAELQQLRSKKAELTESSYVDSLEAILLKMAELYKQTESNEQPSTASDASKPAESR